MYIPRARSARWMLPGVLHPVVALSTSNERGVVPLAFYILLSLSLSLWPTTLHSSSRKGGSEQRYARAKVGDGDRLEGRERVREREKGVATRAHCELKVGTGRGASVSSP